MKHVGNHLPLTDIEMDKLFFHEKASEIGKFISNYPSNIPYALSISGEWGSGKSTMLNFIEHELNPKKCKIIRFNPWMISDSELLIKSLFEEIFYVIDNGFTKAKTKFFEYAQKVIPPSARVLSYIGTLHQGADPRTAQIASVASAETAKELSNMIFNTPLSKIKEKLIKELDIMFVDNDQKIVVMVDELDRLFPDEIITMFQMIKSTLDLPGVFFVVAMDNNVIHDSLIKTGIKKPDQYLQKIFQKNYIVNSKFQLRTLTKEYLLKNLNNYVDKNQEESLRYMIDTFIYLDGEKFYEVNYLSHINGVSPEHLQAELNYKYRQLYIVLRDEFENPRQFIKLAEYLLETFDKVYLKFLYHPKKDSRDLQACFLILVSYFKYPEQFNFNFLSSSISKDENYSKLVRETSVFLSELYRDATEVEGFDSEEHFTNKLVTFLEGFPDVNNLLQ
jgi:KAP family P-loop domain